MKKIKNNYVMKMKDSIRSSEACIVAAIILQQYL